MTSKLEAVEKNIRRAAAEAGRPATDITLVAVSKTKPNDVITPVLAAGHRTFGENKVQEAAQKWPILRESYPDIDLHLIGPLQSNKVRQAIQIFEVIETVDRPKLARAIARISAEEGRHPRCYIQVNVGQEEQKAGILPQKADDFIRLCRDELKLPLEGLMCIPPAGQDPTPYFTLLKEIADRNGLNKLSMGMSGDFETAIRCGATSVRVGTALFGDRPPLG
ncbi:YggS family pyridoxal phosphate-dependent enzyme [Paremcibacter congregatus]|uniref:YggS family pyridoxal phosphate-dependent enzyme n=1 Tax=Paremcibacter congregatus TaxID=2043170 RepID=UPI003A8E310C